MKQNVNEKSLNERVVETVSQCFELKTLYDICTADMYRAYPEKDVMAKHQSEYIQVIMDEYRDYEDLKHTSKEIITMFANESQKIFDEYVEPNEAYFNGKRDGLSPDKMIELSNIVQRASYIQHSLIIYNIKYYVEEVMLTEADWFINFSKENHEKLDTFNLAWNLYMVLSSVVPFRSKIVNVKHDFKTLDSMTPECKPVIDFFVKLAREMKFITETEEKAIMDYIKNGKSTKFIN